jgi:hypothetical protein
MPVDPLGEPAAGLDRVGWSKTITWVDANPSDEAYFKIRFSISGKARVTTANSDSRKFRKLIKDHSKRV